MSIRFAQRLALVIATVFPVSAMAKSPWWEGAVIYEIYPRSFQDSNGDGVGDLPGIIQRLDYLKALGVDAIWLTPIYPSPQVDFGYDVADYATIDPQFGTLKDFDNLVREAKARGIRVLMDMVLNHTSDKHPWFVESMSSKDNPKRDWYVWNSGRPGKAGRLPPNNWQSIFGHSAWTPAGPTGELYYHFFYAQQPDLNWRNPQVEKAMFDAVRFWLDRGAAGYRFDAVDTLFEVTDLHDAKEGPGTNAFGDPTPDYAFQSKQPEVHGVLKRLRALADSYPDDRLFIGEIYSKDAAELLSWYGDKNDELHQPMDLQLLGLDDLDAGLYRKKLDEAQTQLKGNMPLFAIDNHDQPRSWDRYGDGVNNGAIARAVATILLGTRSSTLLYYGQEIGMVTTAPTRKEDVKDPIGITGWPKEKGRDGERTPMQWDAGKNASFTSGTPWLPVPSLAATVNVDAQRKDNESLWHWYRKLIALRRTNPAIKKGVTTMLDRDAQHAVVWLRTENNAPPVVFAVNMKAEPVTLSVAADVATQGRVKGLKPLLMSHEALKSATPDAISLPPFGVYIGQIRR